MVNTVDLVAGRSYYLEAYHINYWGAGFMDIAVGVPNTDPNAVFQTYQVDSILLNSTLQQEELKFSMVGGS